MASADTAIRRNPPRPSKFWWVYFIYLIAAGVIGFMPYLSVVREARLESLLLPAAATLLNLWALFGLWCFIRSKPVGAPWLWAVCFFLTAAQVAFATYLFMRSIFAGAQGIELRVAVVGLCSMLLAIPLLRALWRYAFELPELWKR